MYRASVYFTRKDMNSYSDDRIIVTARNDSRDLFDVKYDTPDLKNRKFTTSCSGVLQYVGDILNSMQHDMDPFEHIQVNTAVHPSVMYHVADMDDSEVRNLILDMMRDALRADVSVVSQ